MDHFSLTDPAIVHTMNNVYTSQAGWQTTTDWK